jgi:hypothetical protein
MSKQSLLTLANFNLFKNTNQEIEFSIAKDSRVQAQYSGYDKQKGYDVRGIKAKSAAGKGYIRLSMSMTDGNGQKEYHNGALFVNDKKAEGSKQPDFQGSVNLDNVADGPKLRLSAWKKSGEKAGDYLSIAIQEFMTKDQAASQGSQSSAAPANNDFDNFNAPAPARQQASQPARQAAPQPAAGFDDMDDIPFATNSMFYDTTTSKARKMARYDY